MITLTDYLLLGAILFCLSVAGIFINRKNVIILLMSIELMLLAVNFNFIAFGLYGRCGGTDFRLLHSHGGGGGIGDRSGHSGGAVP